MQEPRERPCFKCSSFSKKDNGPVCKSLQSKSKIYAESFGSGAHTLAQSFIETAFLTMIESLVRKETGIDPKISLPRSDSCC